MPETTASPPAPDAPVTAVALPAPPEPGVPEPGPVSAEPVGGAEPAEGSRAWLGGLAVFVSLALLAGAVGVLFVRVQDAQDRADKAVTLVGDQAALNTKIATLDASLSQLQSGSATAADLQTARDQLTSLRKCVNTALDTFAQATQSGKPVSITKC
jgi:hypothetical protein